MTGMYNLYNGMAYFLIRLVLIIVILWLGVPILMKLVKGKELLKRRLVVLAVAIIVFALASIFLHTHKFSYKYNDVWIEGKNLEQVEDRYGAFDKCWNEEMTKGGEAGYFLYYDDGFMPDYSNHYLIMEFDENKTVTRVFDGKRED